MDIFERYLFEFDLRVKLDICDLFIHTSFLYFHIGQLHQNYSIIDQNHKINQIEGITIATIKGNIDEKYI
jgi:hypothetical protein